ncbi:MAG: prolipoprotein diacylglyceryl transferase [Clostridiales bacterium]|nr:prolipoprotein diacylglyceryl transferase [Clostridiales bacterium]
MLSDVSISFPNLGIEIENLHKTFSVFGIDIAYYGLIIGIGMLLAIVFCFREAKITGQVVDNYLDIALFGIIFAIVGARIYYVVFEWDRYKDNIMSVFNIRQGGLAIYGGIIGGVLAGYIVCRVKKINFWQVGDTACLGLLIGQIIGRWGNFINREAFGGDSNGLFAMRINVDDIYANVSVPNGVSYIDEAHQFIQVQPTFLYESFLNLMLFILILIFRRKKKYHGEVFLWYFCGYGVIRFFIEGMRTDQLIISGINLPASQLLSAVLVIVCGGILIANRVMLQKKQKTVFSFLKVGEWKNK